MLISEGLKEVRSSKGLQVQGGGMQGRTVWGFSQEGIRPQGFSDKAEIIDVDLKGGYEKEGQGRGETLSPGLIEAGFGDRRAVCKIVGEGRGLIQGIWRRK